jgi:hypothetical protein
MLVLGASAFLVTKAIRPQITPDVSPVQSGIPSVALPIASASAPVMVNSVPSATPSAPPSIAPTIKLTATATTSAPKVTQRTVIIGAVKPSNGVEVAIDGAAAGAVTDGYRITLPDNKAHTLRFTCLQDLCTPQDRPVPEGEGEITISVALAIKPARLVVDGEPGASYQIESMPTISLRPGVPTSIPMSRGSEAVSILQLPSGKKLTVKLTAGKETHVTFPTE